MRVNKMIKKWIKKLLKTLNYELVKINGSISDNNQFDNFNDVSSNDKDVLNQINRFTMTSLERQLALISATRYVVKAEIPGVFIECGVWRGGSSMAMALTLIQENVYDRDLYLFDTFSGMTDPSDIDIACDGEFAHIKLEQDTDKSDVWCVADRVDVEANMISTGYPLTKIKIIEGPVEKTITKDFPNQPIAILRLDTDWYESTKHELVHLFPFVSEGGVIIIDDYGHWSGARLAVDEFLKSEHIQSYMHRIDYTGRLIIKKPLSKNMNLTTDLT
jgi:hypothetical protein